MAASAAERTSAGQLGLAVVLIAGRELGAGAVPRPRQLLGVGIVFSALSVVELVAGEQWGRLAARFGWLFVLALALSAWQATGGEQGTSIFDQLAAVGSGTSPLFPTATPQSQAVLTVDQMAGAPPLVEE